MDEFDLLEADEPGLLQTSVAEAPAEPEAEYPSSFSPDQLGEISERNEKLRRDKKEPLIRRVIDIGDFGRTNNFARQADYVKNLFPGNKLKRLLTYSYLHRVWAQEMIDRGYRINPKSFPVNFIGAPGQGKSATVEDWCEDLDMEMIVRSLAGVSDFESLFGIVHINPETGRTRLYSPERLPLANEHNRYGVAFTDDFNRGEQQAIPAAMEFVNTLRYNDYALPRHFAAVAAMNPHGEGNKVKKIDRAQFTRFCNVVVEGSTDDFLEQLTLQMVPSKLFAYHARYRDQLDADNSEVFQLPEPRPLNKRNRMGHAHLAKWAEYDQEVFNLISMSTYGPSFMTLMEHIQAGDFPISIDELLNDPIEDTLARVKKFIKDKRQDVITATVSGLVLYLNKPDTVLSKNQVDKLCEFWMKIPESHAMVGLRRLVLEKAPRKEHYNQLFMLWRSPDGETAGPLGQYFMRLVSGTKREVQDDRNGKLTA